MLIKIKSMNLVLIYVLQLVVNIWKTLSYPILNETNNFKNYYTDMYSNYILYQELIDDIIYYKKIKQNNMYSKRIFPSNYITKKMLYKIY